MALDRKMVSLALQHPDAPLLAKTDRYRVGCTTCRTRKLKCDEQRPVCSKCAQARMGCDWDLPLPKRRSHVSSGSQGKRVTTARRKAPLRPSPCTANDELYESLTAFEAESSSTTKFQDHRSHSQVLVVRRLTGPDPPSPILSLHNIEMSNSLVLGSRDLRSFQYIPESLMVMRFGKPWRWSMLSHVYSKIAPRESGVMSAFIAVASMELRFRDLVKHEGAVVPQDVIEHASKLKHSASNYLQIALQNMSSVLDRVTRPDPGPNDLQAIFSLWFLLLHCGLYDPEVIQTSLVHLNGIRSFIRQYLQRDESANIRQLPPAAQQLLSFITYAQSSAYRIAGC